MTRLAVALLAFATLATQVGCAGMGTKRGAGAQIQRVSSESASPLDTSSPDARPELGQR